MHYDALLPRTGISVTHTKKDQGVLHRTLKHAYYRYTMVETAIVLSIIVAVVITVELCIRAIEHWLLPSCRHQMDPPMEPLVPQ